MLNINNLQVLFLLLLLSKNIAEMKKESYNIYDFFDLILTKLEGIEDKLSNKDKEQIYKEYMTVAELLDYLKGNAILLSRSKLYKLTSGNTSTAIPYSKVYGKLIFQKREIDLWMDVQINGVARTIAKHSNNNLKIK
jgi:hypothetical protein